MSLSLSLKSTRSLHFLSDTLQNCPRDLLVSASWRTRLQDIVGLARLAPASKGWAGYPLPPGKAAGTVTPAVSSTQGTALAGALVSLPLLICDLGEITL